MFVLLRFVFFRFVLFVAACAKNKKGAIFLTQPKQTTFRSTHARPHMQCVAERSSSLFVTFAAEDAAALSLMVANFWLL